MTLSAPLASSASFSSPRSLALLLFSLSLAAPAAAWEIRADAPAADFAAFHERYSFVAYAFPRHAAVPLGITGFDVYAEAAVDQDLDDEPFASTVIDGDVPAGWTTIGRVGARKGLPGGFDLGASYGRAVGSDLDLAAVELQWALIDGGPLSPALSLRATAQKSLGAGTYEIEQYGVEALLSKGFTVLTPYVGAGAYHSEGTLDRGAGGSLSTDTTAGFVYAGATLNLLLPKITVEVEQGETTQAALRFAFGF